MDKLLSDTGRWSRKEAKELIRKGQVLVNGKTVRKPEEKADPEQAQVTVCGEVVPWQAKCYLLLHKPAGVLTATEDRRQKTVLELLPQPYRKQGVAPVGRLDKDTTGLLLLTNDGALTHQLISPKYHVPKVYLAEINGTVDDADAAAFAQGMTLEDGTVCLPAELEPLGAAVSGDLVRGKIPSSEADAGRSGQAGTGAPSANIWPVVLGTGVAAGTVPLADGGGDLRPPLGCAKAARRGKKFPESY